MVSPMGHEGEVGKILGAWVLTRGSLDTYQSIFVCKETKSNIKEIRSDIVAVRSELDQKIVASESGLIFEVENIKVISMRNSFATIKSLEGEKPIVEMTKQLEH